MLSFDFTTSRTCFQVGIIEDMIFERTEAFQLRLSSDDPVVILSGHEVTVTVTDNDSKSCGQVKPLKVDSLNCKAKPSIFRALAVQYSGPPKS